MNTKFTEKCSWDKNIVVEWRKSNFCFACQADWSWHHMMRHAFPTPSTTLCLWQGILMRNWCASTTYLWTWQIRISTLVQGLLQKQRKFLFPVSNFCNWFPLRNLKWRKMMKCFKKQEWKVFCTGLASLSFSLADFHQAS